MRDTLDIFGGCSDDVAVARIGAVMERNGAVKTGQSSKLDTWRDFNPYQFLTSTRYVNGVLMSEEQNYRRGVN